jgi:hypothetical protein
MGRYRTNTKIEAEYKEADVLQANTSDIKAAVEFYILNNKSDFLDIVKAKFPEILLNPKCREENDEELINFLTVYLSHGNRYWAMRNEKIDYDPDAENWTGDTVTQDYVRTLPANENAEIKRTSFGEVMGKIFKSATGTETETSEKKSDSGIKIILAIVAFVAIIGATFYFRKKF